MQRQGLCLEGSRRWEVLSHLTMQWMHGRRKEGEQMCELTHERTNSWSCKILVMQIFPTNYGVGVVGAGPRPWAVWKAVSVRGHSWRNSDGSG